MIHSNTPDRKSKEDCEESVNSFLPLLQTSEKRCKIFYTLCAKSDQQKEEKMKPIKIACTALALLLLTSCGAKKPENTDGWTCACGQRNKGKFCSECGAKKPEGVPTYRCDKCGWEPADPKNPPKFCPECGDRFDDADKR